MSSFASVISAKSTESGPVVREEASPRVAECPPSQEAALASPRGEEPAHEAGAAALAPISGADLAPTFNFGLARLVNRSQEQVRALTAQIQALQLQVRAYQDAYKVLQGQVAAKQRYAVPRKKATPVSHHDWSTSLRHSGPSHASKPRKDSRSQAPAPSRASVDRPTSSKDKSSTRPRATSAVTPTAGARKRPEWNASFNTGAPMSKFVNPTAVVRPSTRKA